MKVIFISALLTFAGLATADPQCSTDFGTEATGDNCQGPLQELKDTSDSDNDMSNGEASCLTMGCRAGCNFEVCSDGSRYTPGDILSDVNSIIRACAGDGKMPFKGEITVGGRTTKVYTPSDPNCTNP